MGERWLFSVGLSRYDAEGKGVKRCKRACIVANPIIYETKTRGRLKSDFWSVSLFMFAIDAKSDCNTNV